MKSKMRTIKATVARNNFQALVDKIHFSREPIVVTKHNKPWVIIQPLSKKDKKLEKLFEKK